MKLLYIYAFIALLFAGIVSASAPRVQEITTVSSGSLTVTCIETKCELLDMWNDAVRLLVEDYEDMRALQDTFLSDCWVTRICQNDRGIIHA